jgi:predicted nucleic acid-binding Zn ribbon protein
MSNRARYCSALCRRNAWTQAHGIGVFSEERTCAFCGKAFTATRPDRRFCSELCGKRAYSAAHRVVIEPRACCVCGKVFTPVHHKRARFCGAICRDAYHKQRRRKREWLSSIGAVDVDMARVETYLRLPTDERWARRGELNAAELKAAQKLWNEWHREVV